jgi:hypothetical protein
LIAPSIFAADLDGDDVDDRLEGVLLEKFSPYYVFSRDWDTDEEERPTDALWYIRHSDLLLDGDEDSSPFVMKGELASAPERLLTVAPGLPSSNINDHRCRTAYFLNPANEYRGGFYQGDGYDWTAILQRRNAGLYGHVAKHPKLSSHWQVEYWQFYGYNEVNQVNNVADHEGDWELVVVVVNAGRDIVEVTHYVHGKPVAFQLASAGTPKYLTVAGQLTQELEGPNSAHFDIDLHDDAGLLSAQNNRLRLHCSRNRDDCTHPVAYVERGVHAFWPTEHWSWKGAPKHFGDSDFHYLATKIPNLGEVGQPMKSTEGAEAILHYNGLWGAFSRDLPGLIDTSTPAGPALHRAWSWGYLGKPPADGCLE